MFLRLRLQRTFLPLLVWIFPAVAHAWGERGHDLIARVAARVAAAQTADAPGFANVLVTKEHLLGHLANIPDTLWRNVGSDVESANAPTHYIDLEYLEPKATRTFADLPMTMADLQKKWQALCAAPRDGFRCPPSDRGVGAQNAAVGSAPFRIAQLWQRMTAALQKAKTGAESARHAAVDEALLYAGIMAHFVGDLGNPWHTTIDYNGWDTGQGGVHKYFEDDVVNEYAFTLDPEVFEAARSGPRQRVLSHLPSEFRATTKPLALAWALTLDSNTRLNEARALDRQHALITPSREDKGMHIKATRKTPHAVAAAMRPLIVERLATASDVLAQLWTSAYVAAGKPDLSAYQSYRYFHAPEFVPTGDLGLSPEG